jgi:AraC-like DNA-binding protein
MDELDRFLDCPRACRAFILRAALDPPWCLRIEDGAPLSVVAVTQGRVVARGADGHENVLHEGDVGLFRGPDPYLVADAPGREPTIVIGPGQRCSSPTGEPLGTTMDLGTRSWGDRSCSPEATVMLVGTYEEADEISCRVLDALPPVAVIAADGGPGALVGLLDEEISRDEPGQTVVLDRLLDVLTVSALRSWFARSPTAPRWYRANTDSVVGPALRLLRDDPAHGWTVAELAGRIGVSRAALARRFTNLVGEPPMTFLTSWRLALAADRLTDPGTTIGTIAHEVGYGSAFALSAAFKRERGVSPRDHRAALAEQFGIAGAGAERQTLRR